MPALPEAPAGPVKATFYEGLLVETKGRKSMGGLFLKYLEAGDPAAAAVLAGAAEAWDPAKAGVAPASIRGTSAADESPDQ